ncbi:hypothetical protein BB561_004436 [Smittium simulii]|uniref:Translation initiation factor eIF2B subunit gamma n=1 Tax=Smittium simulii TaxID=133385 RepID=A0A2T9YGD6_9FUNG|nr:hypothetical protein BB561_004436 [Smittium simulii]
MELYASEIDKPIPEFTAVVLAGPGVRLFPLSEPDNAPKALNPIGSKPMIWYPLNWLESEGIQDILVVTVKRDENAISSYIHGVYEGSANIIVNSLDDFHGTAEALRQISHLIQTDFIVTSTDVILDIPHSQYLDLFRLYRPDASCILMQELPSEGGGGCSRDDEVKRFYAVDQMTSNLVMIKDDSTEDEILSVKMSLFKKHPSIFITNNMMDLHVYIFRNWVLDYLKNNPDIMSIGYDLIPKLVTMKRLPKADDLNYYRPSVSNYKLLNRYFDINFNHGNDSLNHINYRNTANDQSHSNETDEDSRQIRVFAYIRRGGVGGRANTINRYCDLNKLVSRVYSGNKIGSLAEISNKSQITSDSMVGISTKIMDRCQIKKSVIGAHCSIGNNVKLTNCVIHDYVVIQDNVKLESTVVCRQAKIGAKSQLKDCEIGPQASVQPNTNAKTEQFFRSNNELGTDGVQIKFT